jgi:hypothetical protein
MRVGVGSGLSPQEVIQTNYDEEEDKKKKMKKKKESGFFKNLFSNSKDKKDTSLVVNGMSTCNYVFLFSSSS